MNNKNQSILHEAFKKKLYNACGEDFVRFCSELFSCADPSFTLIEDVSEIKKWTADHTNEAATDPDADHMNEAATDPDADHMNGADADPDTNHMNGADANPVTDHKGAGMDSDTNHRGGDGISPDSLEFSLENFLDQMLRETAACAEQNSSEDSAMNDQAERTTHDSSDDKTYNSFLDEEPAQKSSDNDSGELPGKIGFLPMQDTLFFFYAPKEPLIDEILQEIAAAMKQDYEKVKEAGGGQIRKVVFCINTKLRKAVPELIEDTVEELLTKDDTVIQASEEPVEATVFTTRNLVDLFWSDQLNTAQRCTFLGNPELVPDDTDSDKNDTSSLRSGEMKDPADEFLCDALGIPHEKETGSAETDSSVTTALVPVNLKGVKDEALDVLVHATLLPECGLPEDVIYSCESENGKKDLAAFIRSNVLVQPLEGYLTMHPQNRQAVLDELTHSAPKKGILGPIYALLHSINPNWCAVKRKSYREICRPFLNELSEAFAEMVSAPGETDQFLLRAYALTFQNAANTIPEPDCRQDCLNAGFAFFLLGDYEKAALYQKKGMADPSEEVRPELYLYLIYYEMRAGRREDAMADLSVLESHKEDLSEKMRLDFSKLKLMLLSAMPRETMDRELPPLLSEFISRIHFALGTPEETLDPDEQPENGWAPREYYHHAWIRCEDFGLALGEFEAELAFRSLFAKLCNRYEAGDLTARAYASLLNGILYEQYGKAEEAREEWQAAYSILERDRHANPELKLYVLADICRLTELLGEQKQAILKFEELKKNAYVQKNSHGTELSLYCEYKLGLLYRQDGRPEKALHALEHFESLYVSLLLAEQFPVSFQLRELWYQMGTMYCELGKNDKAIEYLNRIFDHPDPQVAYWLGYAYINAMQYRRAVLVFEEGLTAPNLEHQNPSQAGWLYSGIGLALSHPGQDTARGLSCSLKAEELFSREFTDYSSTMALIYYRTGLSYAANKEKENARRKFDQALSILENNPEYKAQYAAWIHEIRDERIRQF